MGTIFRFLYKQGKQVPALPTDIIAKFDSTYKGPSFLSNKPRCVPILSERNKSDLYGFSHEIRQLPLKLARPITIHKSQRLTLDKAWVYIGKSEQFTGLNYVRLFRVRKIKDWIVKPMTLEMLQSIRTKNLLNTRLWKKRVLMNYQELL